MFQNNKLIWTITDGSQGMISQTLGLAQQLSSNIKEIKTDLMFPWSKLQPGILPVQKWIFKNNIDFSILPKISISCGRKSVYTSLYLKKILKNKILTIHIQNPKINSDNFDFVVAPNHDNYKGHNILNTKGAIHYFTREKINNCEDNFKLPKNKKLISVIIGGPNQHYEFSKKNTCDLIEKIKILQKKYLNYFFYIVPSRRTENEKINLLIKNLDNKAYVWNKKTENPYLFCLKYSNFFIVTSDSTSMISECAFTGKPVYVYHLPFKRKSERIANFHREFEEDGIARKLSDSLNTWKYKNLNEAKRIASILRPRILNKLI